MLIAVLADTHDVLSPRLPHAFAGADEIWHLGDICKPGTLDPLWALNIPMQIVRGNNDDGAGLRKVINITREGFTIRLVHFPSEKDLFGVDLLFHGHTHTPYSWDHIFNPGSASEPRCGYPASYAWLELQRNQPPKWKIVSLE